MAVSPDTLATQLTEAGLVDRAELDALREQHQPADAEALARLLVKHKVLTAYQAQQAYAGKSKALVLGNYVLLDKLGQGGMGMVLKARHRRMNRIVAIKVLSPAVTKTPDALKRFQREVEAAAKLHHPNIVAAYDADEVNGTHFLVLEYVEGTDLSVLVKKNGPLPLDQALNCILQAAKGLEFAHQHGVIHRDIKPANLLLDNQGTVKVLDMGLARMEGETGANAELTNTGAVMGTVDYMAPEQALSTKSADARSDIYSLGISLWYLLVGRPVFDGDSLMARLIAHRETPPPSLKEARGEVPAALDALFQKMIAKKPVDRCQSMTEVIAVLETCRLPQTSSEKSTPSFTTGPSEESKLSEFMGLFGGATDPGTQTKTVRKGTPSATAGSPYEATVTSAQASEGTDPQTLTTLSRTGEVQANRAAWWADRRIQAAILVVFFVATAALFWPPRQKAMPESSGEQTPSRLAVASIGWVPSGTAWHGWPADAPKPAIAPFDAAQARRHQEEWAAYLKTPVDHTNSLGMKFRLMPPGEFVMGTPREEIASVASAITNLNTWKSALDSESPQHRVILTRPIYVSVFETRQSDYQAVAGVNPSAFSPSGSAAMLVSGLDTANHPVEMIDWYQAIAFCESLSSREGVDRLYVRNGKMVSLAAGAGYRLLTEAEWEFAARAGATTRYASGEDEGAIEKDAWYLMNSGGRTHQVGELSPNAFGVFDMQGNVSEWLQDHYDKASYSRFERQPAIDPAPFTTDEPHVVKIRGGAYSVPSAMARIGHRNHEHPEKKKGPYGFRVALSVDAVRKGGPNAADSRNLSQQVASGDGEGRPSSLASQPVHRNFVLRFDGSTSAVEVPSLRFDGSRPITIEAWVNPEEQDPHLGRHLAGWNGGTVLIRGVTTPDNRVLYRFLGFRDDGTSLGSQSASSSETTRPHHVAGVWDGRGLRIFYDGKAGSYTPLTQLRSLDIKRSSWNDHFSIGAAIPIAKSLNRKKAEFFKGTIDEVRVSKVARYKADFTPRSRFESDASTMALYHFDEGSGVEATDASGHGHHGRIVGATWLPSDAGANGDSSQNPVLQLSNEPAAELEFDGVDDYVDLTSDWQWDGKELTFEAWLVPPPRQEVVPPAVTLMALEQGDPATGPRARLIQTLYKPPTGDPKPQIQVSSPARNEAFVSADALIAEQLTHVAAVWSGRETRLFIDGKLQPKSTFNYAFKPREGDPYLWLGALRANAVDQKPVSFWKGRIRQVRVTARALYDGDFTPSPELVTSSDTVGLYRLEEGSGDVLKDSSGHNRHGKIHGATWGSSTAAQTDAVAITSGVELDGIDDYIDLTSDWIYDGGPVTVEVWTTPGVPASDEDEAVLLRGEAPSDGSGGRLKMVYRQPSTMPDGELTGLLKLGRPPDVNVTSARHTLQPQVRTHLAAVFDGKQGTIFVDGRPKVREATTYKWPGSNQDRYLWVGGAPLKSPDRANSSAHWTGIIHKVRISSTARYAEEFVPQPDFDPDPLTEGLYRLDEGSGAIVRDSSGHGRHGKIIGGSWAAPGQLPASGLIDPVPGSCLQFDGATSSVEVPSLKFDGKKPLTFEAWVLATDVEMRGSLRSIMGWSGGVSLSRVGGIPWYLFVGYGSEGGQLKSEAGVGHESRRLHHVAGVWDGSTLQTFFDGKPGKALQVEQGFPGLRDIVTTKGPFCIGASVWDGDASKGRKAEFFEGFIDEVRISQTARYREKFTPSKRFEPDADTLALYHFDEGEGAEVRDASGHGHHGKILGAKWFTLSPTGVSAARTEMPGADPFALEI